MTLIRATERGKTHKLLSNFIYPSIINKNEPGFWFLASGFWFLVSGFCFLKVFMALMVVSCKWISQVARGPVDPPPPLHHGVPGPGWAEWFPQEGLRVWTWHEDRLESLDGLWTVGGPWSLAWGLRKHHCLNPVPLSSGSTWWVSAWWVNTGLFEAPKVPKELIPYSKHWFLALQRGLYKVSFRPDLDPKGNEFANKCESPSYCIQELRPPPENSSFFRYRSISYYGFGWISSKWICTFTIWFSSIYTSSVQKFARPWPRACQITGAAVVVSCSDNFFSFRKPCTGGGLPGRAGPGSESLVWVWGFTVFWNIVGTLFFIF